MKIASVVLVLTILGLATLSSAAVMQLTDSDSDGIIDESQVSGIVTGTQDLNKIAQGAGAAAWYELLVQAEGNELNADPGDSINAGILVLVTYMGAPVDMLTEDHFDLETIFAPPKSGAYGPVRVEDFANIGNGAYMFYVVPGESVTWGAGEYDIQLSVSVPGIAGGQTIASIEVT